MTSPFSFRRHAGPHLLAVLALLLLVVIYFSPIFFDHKTLVQHDVLEFKGGSHEIQQWEEKTGHSPLWTTSMFSGMPSYLIHARYPGDWSQYLTGLFTWGLPTAAANLFTALLCAYLLFVALGMRWWLALGGAIAMGFSSYNLIILVAGHNTKSFALAYAPLVIAGVLVAYRHNRWLGAALLALGLTMQVRSNHPQITYYLGLLLGIFAVVELIGAIREKRLPAFLITSVALGAAAVLAVAVSFGRLYTTASYSKYSNRSKSELSAPAQPGQTASADDRNADRAYAFGWSYGVSETLTLLVPDFYGGASTHALGTTSATATALRNLGVSEEQLGQYLQSLPTYWGDQPSTSGPVYVGAVVCFLFVLGLFIVERRVAMWLLAAAVLGMMLAWGKNFETFNNLMFDLLPGYNKFRAVSMALVIPQLAMPVLALLAAWQILKPRPGLPAVGVAFAGQPAGAATSPRLQQALLRALYVTGGLLALALLAALMADMVGPADASMQKQGFPVAALRDDRAAMARGDVFRSLFFVVATFGVLFYFLKNKLQAVTAGLAISGLLLVDLWAVDKRYVNAADFQERPTEQHFEPTPADQLILQDKDYYRVLSLDNPFSEARTSYFHHSIGGYHGAKLRRYQDLVERQIGQNNTRVLDMLNTRYIIPQDPRQPPQRNPTALGNAWLVREVKAVNTPDAEMAALNDLQPGQTAVVDVTKFPAVKAGQYDPTGATIKLTAYEPEKLTYTATLPAPGVAVFSEVYYADGWNAYLDGKPVPHFRADWVLRAMQLPAGQHQIEFRFEPKEYAIGNTVSMIASILLVLVLGTAGWYGFRRLNAPTAAAAA